jgi:hypothetical protein
MHFQDWARQWKEVVQAAIRIDSASQKACFTGPFFEFFDRFFPVLVNFEDFWASFFLFLSFFRFPNTVYSHRDTSTDV